MKDSNTQPAQKSSKLATKISANKEFKLEFNSLKTVCKFLNSMYNDGNSAVVEFYKTYDIKPMNVSASKVAQNWRIKDKDGNPARNVKVKDSDLIKKVTITSFSAWAVMTELAAYAAKTK